MVKAEKTKKCKLLSTVRFPASNDLKMFLHEVTQQLVYAIAMQECALPHARYALVSSYVHVEHGIRRHIIVLQQH